ERLDPVDAVDLLFERLGDLGDHHVGVGAAVARRDRDDGRVHGGVLAHAEQREPDDAEEDDDEGEDRREDGPPDGEGVEAHRTTEAGRVVSPAPVSATGGASERVASWTWTGWPARTVWSPLVSTVSPGARPSVIWTTSS